MISISEDSPLQTPTAAEPTSRGRGDLARRAAGASQLSGFTGYQRKHYAELRAAVKARRTSSVRIRRSRRFS